ncbi:alpha-terpineol synthase, chloroplastic-like isoform X2 [Phalaenopsis equestris]|uniref:alpha-terpineol synthase, chloroplastic-like isoform X2 n=1 Tax=Phalaenopsis equestris TaxID=78828 RepID=UPI0009E4CA77|nr:alpha-terpineol synthase, chloroplastic-like isoform X2 [Phalaenopsis equestris]
MELHPHLYFEELQIISQAYGMVVIFNHSLMALCEDFLIKCFKNESGSLKVNIINDVKGMLSLYEASYLANDDEDELDEAKKFTNKNLSIYLKEPVLINHSLVEQIRHALELPLHWRMPRLHTRWFIDAYGKQEKMNPHLLKLAKLDFNMLQSIYKKELKEMSRWWKSLGLAGGDFSFARDRLMENYFWSMGCTFEPHFWRCRKEITKIGSFLTTIDDIYDIYGSLEELMIFTDVVNEWKTTGNEKLPNNMKKTLSALFNTMNDIAAVTLAERGLDILPRLKRLWRDQCKAYLVEAIWYHTRYTPTFNEYMENAWITIGVPLLLTCAYCLSEDLTLEALNCLDFYPKVTRYSSMITRLYDDLATSTVSKSILFISIYSQHASLINFVSDILIQDELQRGDVPKSIQCYMMEANVSESVAREHMKYLIEKYWKLLNYEYLHNLNMEECFKRHVLNFPRVTQFLYQNGDGYGKPGNDTKQQIMSVLINPIPL